MASKQLAIVTGASTGIGYELARECAHNGFDLLIAANEPAIETAAATLRQSGATVEAVEAELSTTDGIDKLLARLGDRPVAALLANAGSGHGHAFLEQDWTTIRHTIDTNVTGTVYLLHRVLSGMKARGSGRVLITGSIAGFMPGSYQATYNATKAFIDSFSVAIRNELEGSGVTVSCLMPGATETEFFARAEMLETKVGAAKKDDPAMVAKVGFDAMMKGEATVVAGLHNKILAAVAHVTPGPLLASIHRELSEPGKAG